MKNKKITAGFIIILIALCAFFIAFNKSAPAQENNFEYETTLKLDKILANQQNILRGIDNIMEELQVVKKRVNR